MSPSAAVDPGLVDLFAQLRGGVLITLKRDGRPQSSVVGHIFDPATLTARISVTDGRAKTRKPAPRPAGELPRDPARPVGLCGR